MASSSSKASLLSFISVFCFFFIIINIPLVSAMTMKEYNELQQTTHHHHHVPLTSFFPSSSCTTPPQGRSRVGRLEVVHKHGPCSKLKQQTSSSLTIPHSEMLKLDKARVRAIQSKLRPEKSEASGQTTAATLPATSAEMMGSGNYFVKVGLGTPARELSLEFDTGSDVTWTQCLPCHPSSTSCYSQNEPIFDPSQSSSYSNIPCSSSQCSLLSSSTGHMPACTEPTLDCIYSITYGDKSSSYGNFAKEILTVTPTHVIHDYLFGCGHNNNGLFTGTAGILGLGRNNVSFVQQTTDIFHNIFSYCLPATASDVGYLTFGGVPASDNAIYTPFSSIPTSPSFYAVDLAGISVAGAGLQIPSTAFSSGVIIDSGTVITWLPSAAYGPLRDAFREAMSRYPVAAPFSIFDTCYDLSGYKSVVVPKVTLSFGGGVSVDLDVSGVVEAVSETQVCLAFAENEDESDLSIIGNVQQRTMEVVYDIGGGKIGFRHASCGNGSSKLLFMGVANMVLNYFIYFFYVLTFL